MLKAVAKRAAFYFIPVALLVGMVIAIVPGAPWALLIGFFTAFGMIIVALFCVSDRKLDMEIGKIDAPWLGSNTSSMQVNLFVKSEIALDIAKCAVAKAGGWDITVIGQATVVGWIGSVWSNLPRSQSYQMAIVFCEASIGEIQFLCCARPRSKAALMGLKRSLELVSKLQNALLEMAELY